MIYLICVILRLMESNTACIEDLICECPGMQLADLEQQFDSVRLEYLKNCSDGRIQIGTELLFLRQHYVSLHYFNTINYAF